jgi:predicted HicB family RNase H-like nuclease
MLGGVHGDDEAKVYKELCQAVDEWIEIHEKDGDPLPPETAKKDYSGRFNLRVGKDLHRQLTIAALKKGTSLNQFCVETLKKEIRL